MKTSNFLDLAKSRYSCRNYLNKPVEEEKLTTILEAARIAPSAVNFQPWLIFVLQDNELRDGINEAYPREWFQCAPVALVICGNHQSSWKRSDGKDHCDIDIAIAVDHITLQATELGLATCWICNFKPEVCSKILNLPSHIEPIVMLSLGYPQDSPDLNRHMTKRKKPEEIICFGKYAPK